MQLLDYWALSRAKMGDSTIIKPCHKIMAHHLQNLVVGNQKKPNLMILIPPRIGKSDIGVKAFVGWAQSEFPDSEHIISCATEKLAIDHTKFIRSVFQSRWYKDVKSSTWGCTPTSERAGKESGAGRSDFFYTVEGGSVKAVGTSSLVTGFGAGQLRREYGGAIIMDDLLPANDRHSKASRESVIEYYKGTLCSRRNRKQTPMTPMVLIMQRLHPLDLAGWILQNERHRWNVIEIPAHDENDVSIWEERISMEELEFTRETDPETYWADYMQKPSDAAFAIFRPEWWWYYTDPMAIERRITYKIITADTAFKDKDSSDYTVFQCWGFEGLNAAYLIDQVRGKWEFPELVKMGRAFLSKHAIRRKGVTPVTEAYIEDRASGTSLVQTMRRAGLPFKEWLPKHSSQKVVQNQYQLAANDKGSRGKQCSIPINVGRVFLPWHEMPGYRWVKQFVGECTAFSSDDSHLYDDQVDAMTTALLYWQQRGGGKGPMPIFNKGEVIKDPVYENAK